MKNLEPTKAGILKVLLFLLLLTIGDGVLAEGEQTRFEMANKAFENKAYEQAAKLYEQILKQGSPSATVEYNLGNSYFRMGAVGKAILHYERALLLEPNMHEATLNLEFIRNNLVEDSAPLPDFFVVKYWKAARNALPADWMAGIGLFSWFLGFAGAWVAWSNRLKLRKNLLWMLVSTCLLFGLLACVLSVSRVKASRHPGFGIVVAKSVDLRSAPDASSQSVQKVSEGFKVSLGERLGEWQQVTLQDGEVGWLQVSDFEAI